MRDGRVDQPQHRGGVAAVGRVRRHVAGDDDQRAFRERGGIGGEAHPVAGARERLGEAGLVHRQLPAPEPLHRLRRPGPRRSRGRRARPSRCPRRCPGGTAPGSRWAPPSRARPPAGRPRRRGWCARARGRCRATSSARRRAPRSGGYRPPRSGPGPGMTSRVSSGTPLGSLRRRTIELAAAPLGEPVHLERARGRRSPRCATGSSRPGSCTRCTTARSAVARMQWSEALELVAAALPHPELVAERGRRRSRRGR